MKTTTAHVEMILLSGARETFDVEFTAVLDAEDRSSFLDAISGKAENGQSITSMTLPVSNTKAVFFRHEQIAMSTVTFKDHDRSETVAETDDNGILPIADYDPKVHGTYRRAQQRRSFR